MGVCASGLVGVKHEEDYRTCLSSCRFALLAFLGRLFIIHSWFGNSR